MSLNLAMIVREGARRHPDKTALIGGSASITYGELDERARRFAAVLRAQGVMRCDHVALMVPNVIAFSVAYYGCAYAGCPIVPLNILLAPEEVTYHLDDSDARLLVAHATLVDRAVPGFNDAECEHLIVCGARGKHRNAVDFDEAIRDTDPIDDLPDTRPDDTAVLLYTSGTTGRSKGAELSHFNMFYNAELASQLHGTDASTIALAVLPLFHSFGQTVIQNGTLRRGGTVVLLPRFEPKAAMTAIENERVSFFAGVPTMYFALLHHPEADEHDLSSLRFCASGGAPMPVEVMRAFDERHGTNIIEGYGLSETSPVASLNVMDRPKKPGSIGTPIWGVAFKLIDDDGRTIEETGTPGEICIKGHNVMKGYYKRPDDTADALRDGWFRSGDVATRDDDGYYFIVDRKKDMIIRGGYNVYPREVEEVLYEHPSVREAAVIGVADERLGEEVKAVIALKPGTTATEEEIVAHCREHVAAYKYPRSVDIVDELPKGPTGKILKRALRDA
jgi:long-chain acyl-CoA synthetase